MKPDAGRFTLRIRLGLVGASILALTSLSSGCGDSESIVGEVLSPIATAADALGSGMNLTSILVGLDLTDEQLRDVEVAMTRFRGARSERRGPKGSRGQQRRGRDDGRGKRGPRGSHGPPSGNEPGGGAGEMAFRGEAMMRLVGSVGGILTLEQTSVFLQKLTERREIMRAAFGSDREERRVRPGAGNGRFRGKHRRSPGAGLGLGHEQREATHSARVTLEMGLQTLMERVRKEETSIDDALLEAAELTRVFETELSGVLSAEQMATIKERRAEQLDRHLSRRLEGLDLAMDRRIVFLTEVLHLDDGQVAAVSELVLSTIPARRELLHELQAASIDRATTGLKLLRVERALEASFAELLTDDQKVVLDALGQWLPGPPHHHR